MLHGIVPRLVGASRTMLRPLATHWPAVGAMLIARALSGSALLTACLRRWRLDVGWPLLRVMGAVGRRLLALWRDDGRHEVRRWLAAGRMMGYYQNPNPKALAAPLFISLTPQPPCTARRRPLSPEIRFRPTFRGESIRVEFVSASSAA
ncbi:glycerol-3-phosphate acyltransferase 5-like [Dorcoceras hygrometricum]|uniref:Glycerol-3-phosphate acyltransferase 5-like n=1 Tax=Dorcoceras hygrometricum TaxID=472368 RepID=A0A2Z7CPV2_9LAMI|nr:glycerol-3-phosphate acyltransferase 5-like [Dorcoceras hygrometricum]